MPPTPQGWRGPTPRSAGSEAEGWGHRVKRRPVKGDRPWQRLRRRPNEGLPAGRPRRKADPPRWGIGPRCAHRGASGAASHPTGAEVWERRDGGWPHKWCGEVPSSGSMPRVRRARLQRLRRCRRRAEQMREGKPREQAKPRPWQRGPRPRCHTRTLNGAREALEEARRCAQLSPRACPAYVQRPRHPDRSRWPR